MKLRPNRVPLNAIDEKYPTWFRTFKANGHANLIKLVVVLNFYILIFFSRNTCIILIKLDSHFQLMKEIYVWTTPFPSKDNDAVVKIDWPPWKSFLHQNHMAKFNQVFTIQSWLKGLCSTKGLRPFSKGR